MLTLDIPAVEEFNAQITIPSKERGLVKFDQPYGTQRYYLSEIARGLEDGIHDFTTLKGRQEGITTANDGLRIWWPQVHEGTQGLFVTNNDQNRDIRRDLCLEMLASIPEAYRRKVRVNNRLILAWEPSKGYGGSRLIFDAAGMRATSDLGRSRGVNFLDADELGLWPSEQDIEALRASLASKYPRRLYLWNGTARGYNHFHDMWKQATHSVTQRAIFIGWYRHEDYWVEEDDPRWAAYDGRMTSEERAWIREVKRREEFEILPSHVIWYRWVLDDQFYGNEAMRAQEFPCFPDDAFQSFGDKFIPPPTIQSLRLALRHAPKPIGYQWVVGKHWEESATVEVVPHKAALRVWETPDDWGAYIVAGHPWGSSSPGSTQWVAQVWRAWPDHLALCAEYMSPTGTTYDFAWLLIYLAGAYKRSTPPFMIVEAGGPGLAVRKELQLLSERGYGLSNTARVAGLNDFAGCFQHFFWTRPDKLTWRAAPIDLETHAHLRPYLLHSLADTVIRDHMTIHSSALIDSLSGLRRGEAGDNDQIGAGAGRSDAHAMCAALAVRCWQDQAMNVLSSFIPSKGQDEREPKHVGGVVTAAFMDRLLRTGRTW